MQITQMSRTCDMPNYKHNNILGMQRRIINNMKNEGYKSSWIVFSLKLKINKKTHLKNTTNQICIASFWLSVKWRQ